MSDRTPAIQAEGLSKVFGNRIVLGDVDLQIAEGESVALCGANGTGKTTLLRCLASVLRPTSGQVRWFGRLVTGSSGNTAPALRRAVAMVAHESFLYPHLTLRENLIFAARMCDVRRPAARADQLLANIGLLAHAHRFAGQISRGMGQRLAVARALVHDPAILLLDEPFSGLDREGTDWLLGLLKDLHGRGRTLCFVTHDRRKSQLLADRVLHLQSGRVGESKAGGGAAAIDDFPLARAA